MAVGAAYYWCKRRKYGKYDNKMRKKGKGYWIDPSDKEDKALSDEALKINGEIRTVRERMEKESEEDRSNRVRGPQLGSLGLAVPRESKRVSFFSTPYGWVAKKEEPRDIGRGLGRSDSVQTCESDQVTKKVILDIWLGRKNGVRKGENIEMMPRRT